MFRSKGHDIPYYGRRRGKPDNTEGGRKGGNQTFAKVELGEEDTISLNVTIFAVI